MIGTLRSGSVLRWALVVAFASILPGARGGARAGQQSAGPPNEYAVKAAFLYNFAKFVEWPGDSFPTPASPVVIAVVGSDPFGSMLDETTQGERVNGREIVVRRLRWEDKLQDSHILYVSQSEWRRFPQLLDRLGGSSVLTVGDHDEFAKRGGMIHFMTENYRIRFAINVQAAERAGLKISSKLLSLATIVGGGRAGRPGGS